jgi:hypothetical protein
MGGYGQKCEKMPKSLHLTAHGKLVGVDSGVDIRGCYGQLRYRVPYTMFIFGFGLKCGKIVSSCAAFKCK